MLTHEILLHGNLEDVTLCCVVAVAIGGRRGRVRREGQENEKDQGGGCSKGFCLLRVELRCVACCWHVNMRRLREARAKRKSRARCEVVVFPVSGKALEESVAGEQPFVGI